MGAVMPRLLQVAPAVASAGPWSRETVPAVKEEELKEEEFPWSSAVGKCRGTCPGGFLTAVDDGF